MSLNAIKYTSILVVMFALSCTNNTVYEKYMEVEGAVWPQDLIATFEVDIEDTVSAHNMYINIRNTGDYKYSNLYLFVSIKGPNGEATTDTVNCKLADKSGKWKGKGIGDLWDAQIPYIGGVKFAQKGKHIITYQQAMRDENGLTGITDVGLSIKKAE